MKRIVLTGGPGAGKTIITARIAADHPDRFVAVPEAATQIYSALQTRWDKLDLQGRRDVQRRIYHLQRQQEDRIAVENPGKTLLLDRGAIDGAMYWPDGPQDYWRELETSAANEMTRYDAVIWLETSATLGVYDGGSSNSCRFEDPAAAISSGKAVLRLWSPHPNLKRISAFINMEEKIAAVKQILWTLTAEASSPR